ncbi:hypothetical protein JD844_028659 [Phrynosoma platyrhinos]|uniref:WH2 domain-containing protein n=1 Tax=Phrynosoma platyrhinos TaxID=52577 RepID=A0ABQ7SI78_PHRPL|nr:hypothetical protein JD844_028659 [Phrynosoma platyrhinos]
MIIALLFSAVASANLDSFAEKALSPVPTHQSWFSEDDPNHRVHMGQVKISQQVEASRKQLRAIDDRVSLAQAKIEKIKGSKKAIKVFSSSKYPAPERLQEYSSIFAGAGGPDAQKRQRRKIQSKHRTLDEKSLQAIEIYRREIFAATCHSWTEWIIDCCTACVLQEKPEYFPVCVTTKVHQEDDAEEGLGSLPRNISSLSSLLLFNTTENLYKKYVFLDPLAGAVTKTHVALVTETEKLFDAPLSITKRGQLDQQMAENYFYVPDLGQVPEIDVPSYLPDLPGIAADLMYSADLGPGIAPSAPGTAIPDLPTFNTESTEPFRQGTSCSCFLSATMILSAAALQGAPKEVVNPSSGRATLLESIRQAGGIGKAKLRSVKERKMEKKKQKEQEQVGATGQGGDLMSDLFNKLVLRRKGISGKGPAAGGDNNAPNVPAGAFGRISDTIPPLPPPQQPAGEEDEDDWES